MVRSPVEICLGTSPSQAAKSRFGDHIACADGGHHRAGDGRFDAGHAHQPFATGLARDGFDLVRQTLDPLIEPAPVAGQIFDNADHARRQDTWRHARMRGSSSR